MDNLKGEIIVIKNLLNSQQIEDKIEGIKRVIISMSIGKNMEEIFQSVIKCLELNNLKIKKLIYLYIINNSRNCPNDALMIVNQFCKDSRDPIPIIRALAIRTMGCLRVPKLNEYLIDPLIAGLSDENAYVRKTVILCFLKVIEVSKELVTSKEIPEKIEKILQEDENPKVLATALITLRSIRSFLNQKLTLSANLVSRILEMSDEFMEWDQIYVFDILQEIDVIDFDQIDKNLFISKFEEALIPRLQHFNKALVLASAKLLLFYIQKCNCLSSQQLLKHLKKIFNQLISLFGSNFQTSYVSLQVILAMEKKYAKLNLGLNSEDFFCNHYEPLYVKLLKLKMIYRVSKQEFKLDTLNELCNYIKSTDVEFSLEATKTFFQCALLKPNISTLNEVVHILAVNFPHFEEINNFVLLENLTGHLNEFLLIFFMNHQQNYKDLALIILSQTKFKQILKVLENVYKMFSGNQGKIGFLYIVSIFFSEFSNIGEIMIHFEKNFFNENEDVQLAILRIFVILFLNEYENSDSILMQLFEEINVKHHNPLVRDQAFIYWRVLTKDTQIAKKIFESIPKIQSEEKQIKKEKKKKEIEISFLGTFVNQLICQKKEKIPEFLLINQYQRQLMSLKNKMEIFTSMDMTMLHSSQKKGRKGKDGFEILAKIIQKKKDLFLIMDIKNTSNFIHEILKIEIKENQAGLSIDQKSLREFTNKNIQKNEIFFVEVQMQQDLEKIQPIGNLIHSLTFDVLIETIMDDFEFKVPYLLNLLLNPVFCEFNNDRFKETIQNDPLQLSITSYKKNSTLIGKYLKINRIHEGQNGFYSLRVRETDIAFLKFYNSENYQLNCDIFIALQQYQYLIENLIEKIVCD